MAAVDPTFAQWLQSECLYAVAINDNQVARWGTSVQVSERVSGVATRVAAGELAAIHLAFFSRGPFAIDVHQLVGTDWHRDIGRVVTLAIDQLGYDDGVDVFVLGAEVNRKTGTSSVTVLVPLSATA